SVPMAMRCEPGSARSDPGGLRLPARLPPLAPPTLDQPLAPAAGNAVWNSLQRLGPAEERETHVDAREYDVVGLELRRHAVGRAVVRIVEPAVLPAIET